MSPPVFDYHCPRCKSEREDVVVDRWDDPVHCVNCKSRMTKFPPLVATDVCGSEQSSRVLPDGMTWTSTREREKKMKALGYEPAGDKVGGARNEEYLNRRIYSGGGITGEK